MSIRVRLLTITVNLALACAALSMAAAPAEDDRNSATWYRRAFQRIHQLSQEDYQALADLARTPGSKPDARLRQLLSQVRPILDLAARGTSQATCDFEIEYRGVETLLPHLGDMRKLTTLVQADAMARLSDGDTAGAARQLGQAYRMSDHLSHDGVALNSLVGAAMFNSADASTQYALDQGQVSAEQARVLLDAANSISRDDPFGFIRSMEGERDHLFGWARDEFGGEDGLTKFKEQFPGWMDAGADHGLQLDLTNKAELDFSLKQADVVMDRAIEAMNMPDPIDAKFELEQLEKEIEKGEHGLVSMLMMPAFTKYYDSMVKTREKLNARRTMLQELADGTAQPQEMINAAIAYLEAIRRIEAIAPPKWTAIATAARSGIPPVDNGAMRELDESLRETAEIISLLQTASSRRRCDFSIAQERRPTAAPTYAGGMRDAARLLVAAAVMQRDHGELDQAASNLAACCRMIRHLCSDKAIVSSLGAYAMLGDTADELGRLAATPIPAPSRELLGKSVAKLSEKDLLWFSRGIEADRIEVSRWLRQAGMGKGVDSTQWTATLRRVDAQVLLHLAAAADVQRGAAEERAARVLAARLHDVVDLEALLAARAGAEAVLARCRQSDMPLLSEVPEKPIAPIDQCIAQVPKKIRAMQDLLKPPPPASPAPAP